MTKRFWIVIILLVIGFLGFVWVASGKEAVEANVAGNAAPSTHIIGKRGAPVSLVEYSDFQCTACAAYYPVIEQLTEKYKNRISFEYRHYPLTSIHRNAFAAARASEAAGKQDKFWQMYRLLFINQSTWSESNNAQIIFESYAQQLGLNLDRYKNDFASKDTNGAINASIREFNARGLLKSTPTFLLNGQKIEVRNNLSDFSRLIDEALARVPKR